MKHAPLLITIASISLLLSACGGGPKYNTSFPPPTGKESPDTVFPTDIAGEARTFTRLDLDPARYFGTKADYGAGATIVIVQTQNDEAMDEYVKTVAVPQLEKYSNRVSGKFNGVWSLRGSGAPGRIHGWQIQNWFFVIQASDDAKFEEAVDKLPYIQKL